jgi:hypothetical protein
MMTQVIASANHSTFNQARKRRQFQLVDATALVAAIAVACGLTLWIDRALGGFMSRCLPDWFTGQPTEPRSALDHSVNLTNLVGGEIAALCCLTLPLIVVLTLSIVPIRLFKPRPRFRRLVRQPGAMGAVAASFAIVIAALQVTCTVLSAADGIMGDDRYVITLLGGVASYPGLAVYFVWMTIIAGGRWRAEPDWIDRVGRALGTYWIMMAAAMPAAILRLSGG